MRKLLAAVGTAAALAMVVPTAASAQHWRHGWHHGWGHGHVWRHRGPGVTLRFGRIRHHYASCWSSRRVWRHGWRWRRVWVC
jgi:hypothetical protein